jgi:hypothetical protein
MAEQITILDVAQVDAIDPARRGKHDALVAYQVGTGVGRILRVPYEGLDKARLETAVRAHLADIRRLAGHSFTL